MKILTEALKRGLRLCILRYTWVLLMLNPWTKFISCKALKQEMVSSNVFSSTA